MRDLREPNQLFCRLEGHKQEVCGLKWSFDGQQLASGGNDNKLMIWNLHSDKPLAGRRTKMASWQPAEEPQTDTSASGILTRCSRCTPSTQGRRFAI